MKKIIYLLGIGSLLLNSCYDYYEPYADFTASDNPVEPNEMIYFTNHSTEADEYFWDFGDGYTSNSYDPEHYYDAEGTYTVTLTASAHHGGSDVASMTIEVYYFTQLEVTVAEWNTDFILQNRVPNAEVTLYATYDDWYNLRHPIETRNTNSSGVAFFPHVEATGYFIDVYHPYYNNEALGQEDVFYIETDPLTQSALNTFTAWVDYVPAAIQQQKRDVRLPYMINETKRAYKKTDVLK